MKITKQLTILTFCLIPLFGYCQSDSVKKDLVIITGYQIQKNHFGEIGIGLMKNGVVGHHPRTLIYGLSNELKLSNDFIWGLKAGLWMGGGAGAVNMGLNLIN